MLMSLRSKLFISFLVTILLAVAIPYIYTRNTLREQRIAIARRDAILHTQYVRTFLSNDPSQQSVSALFEQFRSHGARITVIAADGHVLQDSSFPDGADFDNHDDRPEIIEARSAGVGYSIRQSNTLGIRTLAVAMPLNDHDIVRVSQPFNEIYEETEAFIFTYSGVTCIGILLALFLSSFYSRRLNRHIGLMTDIVQSISQGKYNKRLRSYPGEEFVPLAGAVHRMADNIEASLKKTREQQEVLETILQSMNEGVLVLDTQGNILKYNTSFEFLFPEAHSAVGKQVVEALPVPLLQRRVEELLASDKEDTETLHFEFPSGRFFMVNLSRAAKATGNLGAILVFSNITELMRLERVRRDFVANVSHELRTPLTAITGYAETLMSLEAEAPECRQFASVIYRQGTLLAKVVGDLLALSRIENKDYGIDFVPVKPALIIRDALSISRSLAEKKDLRFQVDISPDLVLQSNTTLLTQVFSNLLDNACKHSPEGGEVGVYSEKRERDALFMVTDHGRGIPFDEQSRVFERFYQVEKDRGTASAGIGLAICKHIVERHGGRIWVESPYKGFSTAVMFTIPLAAPGALPETRPDETSARE